MKTITKLLAGALATASVTVGSAPASAAVVFDDIDSFLLAVSGSDFFGANVTDEPGAFAHVFNFSLASASEASSSVTSIQLGATDIDFSSILLDGINFTQIGFDPAAENWELTFASLASGPHSIFVNGSVVGSSQDGAYSGVLNVTPVPEPTTWAMMLVGFGAVGAVVRFRRRKVVHAIA